MAKLFQMSLPIRSYSVDVSYDIRRYTFSLQITPPVGGGFLRSYSSYESLLQSMRKLGVHESLLASMSRHFANKFTRGTRCTWADMAISNVAVQRFSAGAQMVHGHSGSAVPHPELGVS